MRARQQLLEQLEANAELVAKLEEAAGVVADAADRLEEASAAREKAELRLADLEELLATWPVRTRVVVSLKSGKGFRGVLAEISEDLMILRNAELVDESEHRTQVDGEVFIERVDVDFVQVPHR